MLVRCVLIVFAALCVTVPARADGTIYRASGCGDYLYVSTATGYSELVSSGTTGIKDGDTVTGNVERIGQPVLFDQTAGRSLFARVAEQHLTLAEVTQRIAIRCRSPLGDALTSGYVSRAEGCGNKVFVNTAQGYAVLEQIAGGTIADGDTLTGNFNKPGRATVTDQQSATTLVVFVEDLWLSKSAAERKMNASCRVNRRQ
ncbi:MAG TPA: hypothetical protein VHY35_07475 [Stellaceae bacterium]|jgi:hypothetical protein|nr:hypothetical protein [Stellaceae bacterium]